MFAHMAASAEVRASATVTTTVNVEHTPPYNRQRAMAYVLTVTGRTGGSVTATLQASYDGGDTWVSLTDVNFQDGTKVMNANQDYVAILNRPLPDELRWNLVPSSFDGSVAITCRSSDLLTTPATS
jgi:hypothetical protein